MLGNPFDFPDSPKEVKAPESWRRRIARGYFVVCMACSQALLMVLLTPLRLVMREGDVQALMPILLPMLQEGRRLAINQGMAREVAAMDGPTRPLMRAIKCSKCGSPGYISAGAPDIPFECPKCAGPEYLVACESCRVILAGSGGSKAACDAFALESGWFVDKGQHYCPDCWHVGPIPQDPGVVCQTHS